jgi:hypothetical protein
MTINVSWDSDQKTIIRWDFKGVWKWDDFNRAREKSFELMDTVDHIVDFMIDTRECSLVPHDLASRIKEIAYKYPRHRNGGIKVVLGTDSYLQLFWNIFSAILPRNYRAYFASTPEEARDFIRTYRNQQIKQPE